MVKRSGSFVVSDESGDDRPAKVSKKEVSKKTAKGSSSSSGDAAVDADGNIFWELASNNKRRVTINKFSNKWLVNVREYYEDKAGEMKPTKKGISMSVEQYQDFLNLVPSINKQLRKNGVALEGDVIEDNDEDEDEDEKPAKANKKSKKTKVQSRKANIEATSDEGEDDEED